ncbi:alpha/beta fold hydrolase [Streptomyces sp. NPDC059909]|uniref:alpha/beta fold hydrolase n=1 Tax=Streptomyces sp. NPDC059909 TaxID=3346998 RepID=UPI003657A69A
MSVIDVGDARLYYERYGHGPAVLFISGVTGDAGLWTRTAQALADEFTVVAYDRRGNSRSPRPEQWTSTSVDEQADDAAGLLRGLGIAPAVVVGASGGGAILTNLVLRHPEVVRAAVIHEPPFVSESSDPDEVGKQLGRLFEQGMATGDPKRALEGLLLWAWGEEGIAAAEPDLRRRLLANAEVFLTMELGAFIEYLPSPQELAGVTVPCIVAAGAGNRDPAAPYHHGYEESQWLATHMRTDLIELPGAHAPYLTHPTELTDALRPLLRALSPNTGRDSSPRPPSSS